MATQEEAVPAETALPDGEKKKISLRTSDGQVFQVVEDVAMEFQTVKAFFGDESVSREMVMPLPNVDSSELVKIINFCTKNLELKPKSDHEEAAKKDLKKFYADFLKDETTGCILELILAVDYLNVNGMLDLLNQTAADRIQNKSVEYARKLFGVQNDFTPEEEQALREEYAWAFDGVDAD